MLCDDFVEEVPRRTESINGDPFAQHISVHLHRHLRRVIATDDRADDQPNGNAQIDQSAQDERDAGTEVDKNAKPIFYRVQLMDVAINVQREGREHHDSHARPEVAPVNGNKELNNDPHSRMKLL